MVQLAIALILAKLFGTTIVKSIFFNVQTIIIGNVDVCVVIKDGSVVWIWIGTFGSRHDTSYNSAKLHTLISFQSGTTTMAYESRMLSMRSTSRQITSSLVYVNGSKMLPVVFGMWFMTQLLMSQVGTEKGLKCFGAYVNIICSSVF